MNRNEIYQTISDFLSLFEIESESIELNQENLRLALDRLALASNFVDYEFDETDYPDAPSKDYDELRAMVSKLFPNYGFYNVVTDMSVNVGLPSEAIGDAIDDIVDIAKDLYEVEWLWENTTEDNALWQFSFGYNSHWGEHLRWLQLYILAEKNGQ